VLASQLLLNLGSSYSHRQPAMSDQPISACYYYLFVFTGSHDQEGESLASWLATSHDLPKATTTSK